MGEKSGRVRLYDLATEVPIMCLETGAAPLMSVDWSPSNSLYVGGVANGSWFVWDTSQSRYALFFLPLTLIAYITFVRSVHFLNYLKYAFSSS